MPLSGGGGLPLVAGRSVALRICRRDCSSACRCISFIRSSSAARNLPSKPLLFFCADSTAAAAVGLSGVVDALPFGELDLVLVSAVVPVLSPPTPLTIGLGMNCRSMIAHAGADDEVQRQPGRDLVEEHRHHDHHDLHHHPLLFRLRSVGGGIIFAC